MLLPVGPNNRISNLLGNEPPYIPLHSCDLEKKLKELEWNYLREEIFVSFTPLNKEETVTVKGILDYSEVSRVAFKMREQNVNVIILQFKTDSLTKLNETKKEESIQIEGSNTFMIGNNVYTTLVLFDGEEKEVAKLKLDGCGTLNRFGSYRCYMAETK